MQDGLENLDEDLSGLKPAQWKARMAALAEEHGMYQPLGDKHFATFIDQGNTLLVTFETVQGIHNLSDQAQPLGFDLVKNLGWSHMCVISDGDTWFREGRIYGFFDQLIDDGFFDEFDKVIFYGAGPCGYAAAAYSVASPGATVVAVQPQATLDRLAATLDGEQLMTLTAMVSMTGLTGSGLLTLAFWHRRLDADAVWAAAHVDEDYQITQWGEDAEAAARLAMRRVEFDTAVAVLAAMRP